MRRDYDCVVVGLGGIGGAAAYWLARAGHAVLGFEQFEIGHARGASHDHSRIIRQSYHSPVYVELAAAAYAAWAELESDAGEELILRTGGLDLWPRAAAIPMSDYTVSMEACGVAYETLDAGAIMRRWPQWRLDDDVAGLFQERGGIVGAHRCNAAHVRLARRYGAQLREHTPVDSIRCLGGELEVVAGTEAWRCSKLVLAADAWTNELLAHLGARLPLTVTQEQVTYWAPTDLDAFSPERFPVWIWMDEPSFYGVPVFGEAGIKAAQDVGGKEVTARARTFDVDREALARVEGFLRGHLPSALGRRLYTKSCLYTMPPDRDFVIDSLPGHDDVFIALGAAHGFKFASLMGKIMSELVAGGTTAHDIDSFRTNRHALIADAPVKSFMI